MLEDIKSIVSTFIERTSENVELIYERIEETIGRSVKSEKGR